MFILVLVETNSFIKKRSYKKNVVGTSYFCGIKKISYF